MSTHARLRIGPQAYMFAIMGALFLLASVMFATLGLLGSRSETPPVAAIEGTVEPGPLAPGPFGQQVSYGYVCVEAVRGKRHTVVHEGSVGSRSIQLRTPQGVQPFVLPAYSNTAWKQDSGTYKPVQSLDGTGLEHLVKGWQSMQRDRFYVEFHYIAPGQPVIVDTRTPSSPVVWFGSRQSIEARARDHEAMALKMWGFASAFTLVFGVGLIALHFVFKRRLRAATPSDHSEANIPAWIALAVKHKGGRYEAEIAGRRIDAMSAYRKHAMGPIVLTVTTPLSTRLSFMRGPGLPLFPAAAAAGTIMLEGDSCGYPGLKITGADPEWTGTAIQNPAIRNSVMRLMDPATHQADRVSLALRPGKLMLSLGGWRPDAVNPAGAAIWLNEMFAMAASLESLPPARESLQRTRLEQLADSPRGQVSVFLVFLAVLVGFAMVAFMVLIFLLG